MKINNIEASTEEYLVFLYLEELKENGFIDEINFQPEPFKLSEGLAKRFYTEKQLKNKVKKVYRNRQYLINPHTYTTDFKVLWNTKSIDKLVQWVSTTELRVKLPFIFNCTDKEGLKSYLEVKPGFDQNNMTRMFTSHIQPIVWDKHNIYVQLIKPITLFKETFIPKSLLSDFYYKKNVTSRGMIKAKKGDKKFSWEYKTLDKYLEQWQEIEEKD